MIAAAQSSGTVRASANRYTRTRERLDRTTGGHLYRRGHLVNQAMALAAPAFLLLIPALATH